MKILHNLFKKDCLIIYSTLFFLLSTSCITTKQITYFQSKDLSVEEIVAKVNEKYIPRVQKGDILSITVSSLNREADEMFNPFSKEEMVRNVLPTVGTITPQPIIGFSVDDNGHITFPVLNNIQVAGLTTKEISDLLTQKLSTYLKSPTVTVRIANFKISILGEVVRPAVYTISNGSITLPEALALAGGVTIYGKSKNVLIIRETNGNREFVQIDLTGREIFNSPYYYLHSGDIIYVEPHAAKATSTDRIYQLTPIVISSLTLLVLIINTFSK